MTFVEEPGEATTTGEQENQEAVRSATPQHFPEVSSALEPQSQEENENERLLLFSDCIPRWDTSPVTYELQAN